MSAPSGQEEGAKKKSQKQVGLLAPGEAAPKTTKKKKKKKKKKEEEELEVVDVAVKVVRAPTLAEQKKNETQDESNVDDENEQISNSCKCTRKECGYGFVFFGFLALFFCFITAFKLKAELDTELSDLARLPWPVTGN